ncbi:cobalamin-binding protein [Anaerobacillus alkaliphilus]|uniref:Cobalamin-binding protein n=1 Tax=Anaerobacillus alkaliphilus TaxID=1548597 RepID=A0A4Q0VTE5_9BACI|nr:cobalamin-binding protein [Anaerobacillus alkaliphilus]RXJ01842.1 cobalamin-binding protein [Anaerobacillus alkaliphilus]
MRIISICPSNTELLAYLGLTDQIVAVDDFSNWPEEINQLPRLGPDLNIDMDKLELLAPDIVLASLSVPGMERNVEQLVARNIPHIVLNPNSLEDIYEDLLLVGEKTNITTEAKKRAEEFKNEIDLLRAKNKQANKGSIYWEWWPKPIFTPGKTNWLTEVSEIVGGENCFSIYDKPSVQVTWEEVIERNPDHICMVWVGVKENRMNLAAITKRERSNEINAVKENNLYILEEALFCRPSPRLIEGIRKLSETLN